MIIENGIVRRAADFQTAQEVVLAVELARVGAASALIEQLTGFGSRSIRRIVREHGGALAMKFKDPVRWLEDDPQRLLHARFVLMPYVLQPSTDGIARKLLNTYNTYRQLVPPPQLLDVNECAQVIDLYQEGNAWLRECSDCQEMHLVLTERSSCPLCRFIAREFCRGCHTVLPPANGRPRGAYCDECSPRSVRLAIRRKTRRIHVKVRQEPAMLRQNVMDALAEVAGSHPAISSLNPPAVSSVIQL
jgi:hypothetical protein